MVEERQFKLIKKFGRVEIRQYLPVVMADVLVNSEYKNAANIGFRPLVSYISQNNIAMTAPVIQEQNQEGSWVVSFVMPNNYQLSNLPLPSNTDVTLRESPSYFAAALPFSGITTWEKVSQKEKELQDILKSNSVSILGSVQIARFDPPWKPGFMRRNEVIFPVNYQE